MKRLCNLFVDVSGATILLLTLALCVLVAPIGLACAGLSFGKQHHD